MTTQAVPRWFWIVSTLALLWSLVGVGAFAAQISMSPAQLAQLTEAQRNAFTAMPAWLWATFGVATITALAASICLLLRRAWAVPLFAISLVAVLTQYGWVFGVYRILRTMPVEEAAGLPVAIIVIALLSLWLARFATKKGWLN